ncbi:MAG: ferritin-like domain-containing protein [Acidobacteria bacterium]|nr:ferritin-like domain-containing protein [Acidobacteriota bacterium]
MAFETSKDVLDWYERQERTLTDEFIGGLPWSTVRDTPLDEKFIPVLLYMRDVEVLTDMYHRELRRTPTGRDPVIAKFMERWGVEEITHGQVINRFLNEAGYETPENWQAQTLGNVPSGYHLSTYLLTSLTNLLGSTFTATHMAFGAIHEMSTAQAYRRMIELAAHPVLTRILEGIIREEAAHTQFYWSVARLELKKSTAAQKMARKVVETFWRPVGQGSLAKHRTDYSIAMLFSGDEGTERIDRTVTRRARELPGFGNLTKITTRVKEICDRCHPASQISAASLLLSINLYSVL